MRQFLPNRGGLEDVVANLARQTLEAGFRVKVVTLDTLFTAREQKLAPHEYLDGIEIVRIPWRGSSRYPLAPTVFRHLGDADIVHVHAIDFFFDALAIGRLMHRKPMVATTHGGFFHTQAYAALKTVWFNSLTRFSASAYRNIVCCSASDMSQFAQIASSRCVLIENGVDIGKFANSASRTPQRRIVTIGRFSLNKGLANLVATVASLPSEWTLDIIGAESDLTRSDLEQVIEGHHLSSRIRVHVEPDNDQIRELLAQASIFASASDYEGFGLVALEAMSAGLCPVLNPNEAFQTLAQRHQEITLADFHNPKKSADAIEAAFQRLSGDDETVRTNLMNEARGYSWDFAGKRYLELYRNILS